MNQAQKATDIKQDADSHCECEATVTPLRKRGLNGEIYTRPPEIETLLNELVVLPRAELIDRAGVADKTHAKYIPSECLVYFVRASRHDENDVFFERLYRILVERVLRSVQKKDTCGDKTVSLRHETIRDYVYSRFIELLVEDRRGYVDKLDFFEVRFNSAIFKLKCDARRKSWKNEELFQPLEYTEGSNELSPQVERAAGSFDPPESLFFDDPIYRTRFEAAIMTLPPEQARVIHMLELGFRIDSKEPEVMTIAKALGRCEKTVRNYRDKAFAALRAVMANGEDI